MVAFFKEFAFFNIAVFLNGFANLKYFWKYKLNWLALPATKHEMFLTNEF